MVQESSVYQHLEAKSQSQGSAVVWDAAPPDTKPAPHPPPHSEEGDEEEEMDMSQSDRKKVCFKWFVV